MALERQLLALSQRKAHQFFFTTSAKTRRHFQMRENSGATSPGKSFYYSQKLKGADEVLERVGNLGIQASALEADLSDPAVVPMTFDRAEATLGAVEVLVNNAAYWEGDTFLSSDAASDNKLVELWTDRPQSIGAAGFNRLWFS